MEMLNNWSLLRCRQLFLCSHKLDYDEVKQIKRPPYPFFDFPTELGDFSNTTETCGCSCSSSKRYHLHTDPRAITSEAP